MTWTKEPWIVEYMGSDESDVVGASGVSIICGMSDANARRIVACVNACAGIPTDALDGGSDEYADLSLMIGTLSDQRDELLAALKEVLDGRPSDMYGANHEAYERAESLIARMEERK